MNVIGKWVLGTMVGYFAWFGYYILTFDHVTQREAEVLSSRVRENERIHRKNEENIAEIKATTSTILDFVRHRK